MMTQLTRQQLLTSLEQDWGGLISRFRDLPPTVQRAWLAEQGYVRLGDLLAHVIAWWDEAYTAVSRLAAGQPVAAQEYDVDAFNAAAMQRFAGNDETQIIDIFEARRQRWIALLASLPDAALDDPEIARRLHMDLIGHFQEHLLAAG